MNTTKNKKRKAVKMLSPQNAKVGDYPIDHMFFGKAKNGVLLGFELVREGNSFVRVALTVGSATFRMNKADFDKLVKFYTTPQKVHQQ